MQNLAKVIFLVTLVFGLVGCEARIDGSSDEAFQTSLEEMKEPLNEEEREELGKALLVVALKDMSFKGLMAGTQTGDTLKSDTRRALDGKTREEILDWAQEIRAEREKAQKEAEREARAAELERAREELETLKKTKAEAAAAQKKRDKFQVLEASFEQKKQRFMGPRPIVDLKVKNGTEKAVSRVYFEGTLKSPGREVPWLEEEFNYEISGGIEPGETVEWSLRPNQFSDWGTVEPDADAILHVTVIGLDGADGKPLFSDKTWSDEDEERLEELAKTLAATEQ